tara:strand:- start:16971 stop:18005 length:1035 start_codon:yes stop_codon:yes gene_type:complete
MINFKRFIFNFSSSYTGGGLKRLLAFSKWFNKNGGAHFIVNTKLNHHMGNFQNNSYYYVNLNRFQKTLNLQGYVKSVFNKTNGCDFYYSYNIPMKKFNTKISWFHLSNVLPLISKSDFNIPTTRKIELRWLGVLIKKGLSKSDFISAESNYSLDLISNFSNGLFQLSLNGSDDELRLISKHKSFKKFENFAVLIGTYYHKNLEDSFKIFKYLKLKNKNLKLHIFGEISTIPLSIAKDSDVILHGIQNHSIIIDFLQRSSYYINTSLVENSWNAAAEGVFLSRESFISDIPPHRELIKGSKVNVLRNINTTTPLLNLKKENNEAINLTSWDEEIKKIIYQVNKIK